MKLRTLGTIAMAVLLIAGCKSKETTSSIIHFQTGRYDLAIKTASEAIAKDPNDAEAHFYLALSYGALDSLELSYNHFMRAKELDPARSSMVENNVQSNYAKHYNLALPFIKGENPPVEDLQEAAKEFRKATLANPMESKAYYQLGSVYAMIGETDESYFQKAIPQFDKVLELATPADKHYIDALSRAGTVFSRIGRPQEAISRFSRLIEEDPTNYRVIEKIGNDLLTAEDWIGASVFLDLAARARAKIGAEDFTLYYNIGVAHFQARDENPESLTKAVEFYEKALGLKADEPQTTLNIVKTYFAGEDWPQAATWGERYVTLKPDDPTGWRLLARVYNELGDKDKARQCSSRYESLMEEQGGSK